MRWNPSRQEWVTYSATRKVRTSFPPEEYCPLCPGAELNFPTEIPFKNFEVAIFPIDGQALIQTIIEMSVKVWKFNLLMESVRLLCIHLITKTL